MRVFAIDVYVLDEATNSECLEIELKFEELLGTLWDETDTVDGRIRYRHMCSTRSEASALAAKLAKLDLKAEVLFGE